MKLLILLVGSNPLPLFATAKFLLDVNNGVDDDLANPDKIVLIHTKETVSFAENLFSVLKLDEQKRVMVDLEDEGRNPTKIRKKIIDKLDALIALESNGNHVVHLNYIGGTKPMAVQALLAVTEWTNDKPNIKCVFSDVDPELDKIIFSDTGYGLPVGNALKDFVNLKVEELMVLHDMTPYEPGKVSLSVSDRNELIHFCNLLWEKYNNPSSKKFANRLAVLGRRINSMKTRDDNETEKLLLSNDKIKHDLAYFGKEIPLFLSLFSNSSNPTLKRLTFLTSGWLEELVHSCLINLKLNDPVMINEVRRNLKAQHKGRSTELDVVAIKGYTLFLFTCTISNKIGTAKQKAFEAIYRANQLGGEHAKVIVVSTLFNDYYPDDPTNPNLNQNIHNLKELHKDLEQFDAKRNCRLIGLKEIVGEIEGKHTLTKAIMHILEGGK